MKRKALVALVAIVMVFALWACNSDDDTTDGDTTDGDTTDGDTADGDTADGDTADGDVEDGDIEDGDMTDGDLDISVCDPETATFTLNIDNPYYPLPVGRQLILEGYEGNTLLRVEFTVLDETETVAGVETRVIEERETEDGELVEVSRNFFAQADDGTVCYFGEDVDDVEDGEVVGHGGAWRAGENGAKPGIIMPANPVVGAIFKQEVADGVAEDTGEIIAMGEELVVPAGTFSDTVEVRETSPLDLGSSRKVFVSGIGMAVDSEVELIEYTE